MTTLMLVVWLVAPRVMPSLIPLAITAGLLARVAHAASVTAPIFILGFIVHLIYGGFWGGLIALSSDRATAGKGIVVGLGLWLMMMIFYFPMSGRPVVSLATDPGIWIVTLIGHVIYGATVGALLHRDQRRGFHGEHALVAPENPEPQDIVRQV